MNINCNFSLLSLLDLKGDFKDLPPNDKFELTIRYPLTNHAIFEIETGQKGIDFFRLLQLIGNYYNQVYADKNDKYGIWGHGIGDLYVEGISVDYQNKKITLLMGS